MFSLGIPCNEVDDCNCQPEKISFRSLVADPISVILEKNNKQTEDNVCLKTHTFWSVIHGLISIKMMRTSDVSEVLNKMVMDDAIEGFIKNLA
jgi:choline-glycine betaine transporter